MAKIKKQKTKKQALSPNPDKHKEKALGGICYSIKTDHGMTM